MERLIEIYTMEDAIRDAKKKRVKSSILPVSDKEVFKALESYGGFNEGNFERVGNNVVIAEGGIVVVKKEEGRSAQVVLDVSGRPFQMFEWDKLRGKVWCTDEIYDDVKKAHERLFG